MSTIHTTSNEEQLETELGRMAGILIRLPGIVLVDTSWITSFCRQRVGDDSRGLRTQFYTRLINCLSGPLSMADVSFPLETRTEFGQHLEHQREYAKRLEDQKVMSEEDKGRVRGLNKLIGLMQPVAELMRCFPSEAYLTPQVREIYPRIVEATSEVMSRKGVSRDFSERYGHKPGLEEHKYHDARILATGVGAVLSRPMNRTIRVYMGNRDSDIGRGIFELRRQDDEGLRALSRKYGLPCFDGAENIIKDAYDGPPLEDANDVNQPAISNIAAIPAA